MSPSPLFTGAFLACADGHFLAKQLSNDTVCVDVDPALIEQLLTWDDLNHILATRPLQPPRLRLHRRGQVVPVDEYTEKVDEAGEPRRVVRPPALYSALRDGASLVLDAIDRLHPPIRAAADDLMGMLHERVQTNLYLLWGDTFGFDTHWDDHDTFIIQVAGTKHWKVHGPGRRYPMKIDSDQTHTCPEAIAWEGTLRPGQILHVPRGWWHTVTGTGDVSAHLTFGFTRATGMDWAASIVEHLHDREIFRQDLPRFASDEQRDAHQHELADELVNIVRAASFDRFLADRDARFPRRQAFSFPWVIDDADAPADTVVHFTPLLAPKIETHPDRIVLVAVGKRFSFVPTAASLLHELTRQPKPITTIGELSTVTGSSLEQTNTIVRRLACEHLVTLRTPAQR